MSRQATTVWFAFGRLGYAELTQIACHAARRNFTQEEWERFFGDKRYEEPATSGLYMRVLSRLCTIKPAQAEQGDIPGATAKFKEAMTLDPSLKVEPEAEAKRLYAPKVVDQAHSLAEQGDISGATTMFKEALALDPGLQIEPEVEAKRLYAWQIFSQAVPLASQGDIPQATAKLKEALALDPSLTSNPQATETGPTLVGMVPPGARRPWCSISARRRSSWRRIMA